MTNTTSHTSASKSSSILAGIIDKSNGKIVSCSFVKKDGTVRNLVGRLGVTKSLKGGTKTVDSSKYITIYDMSKQAYRSINRDTILSVRTQGVMAVATS
jgi:hypothetical protein